mmetsp:Transcript_30584/g.79800  ORF Transcript_30584/g.79800 Transcript_30584/m.79800 type:complete len:189 (-) Transcript_30584:2309-2875(-)
MEFLRKYIAFARKTISPVLSSSAATKLARHYCSARAEARGDTRQEDAGSRGATGSNENAIPITVRQLEAIVRLSESIAKICLMSEVTEEMVDEAYRLFQTATVDAIKHGQVSFLNDEVREEILKVMDRIHSHVPVESRISRELLFQQLRKENFGDRAIAFGIHELIQKRELVEYSQGQVLKRIQIGRR